MALVIDIGSDVFRSVRERVSSFAMFQVSQMGSIINIAVGKRSDARTSALVIYEGSFVFFAARPIVGALAVKLPINDRPHVTTMKEEIICQ